MTRLLPDEPLVVDLFAGPGGWSEGLRMLSLGCVEIGVERDDAACRTRRAAGHLTVRADALTWPCAHLRGRVWGVIGSPPCPTFSTAGKGDGMAVIELIEEAMTCEMNGEPWGWWQRTAARLTRSRLLATSKMTKAQASERAWAAARQAFLVCAVIRTVRLTEPEWVACEQVPPAKPLFDHFANLLRRHGYSTWCGVLNAADYGVPQTRQRVFLTASRVRTAFPPLPTHAKDPHPSLFGVDEKPWVSMASALGWGMDARPYLTVAPGHEPALVGGAAARDAIERERAVVGFRRKRGRGMTERHGTRPDTPVDEPAPTLTSKWRADEWVVRTGANSRIAADVVPYERNVEKPAPTVDSKAVGSWCITRPATTIVGSFRPDVVAAPGYPVAGSGPRQNAEGSIKITEQEALVLQSFRRDYPLHGSRTERFEQIGNAVPPLLAAHVLAAITGAVFDAEQVA